MLAATVTELGRIEQALDAVTRLRRVADDLDRPLRPAACSIRHCGRIRNALGGVEVAEDLWPNRGFNLPEHQHRRRKHLKRAQHF